MPYIKLTQTVLKVAETYPKHLKTQSTNKHSCNQAQYKIKIFFNPHTIYPIHTKKTNFNYQCERTQ